MTPRLAALGAHVYAGGHTVGVRAAGFEVTHHLEESAFGVATARKNLGVEVLVGRDSWNAAQFAGRVDWFYSNPPCAAWSQAGMRHVDREAGKTRGATDDRIHCARRCFAAWDETEAPVFSWESVDAALRRGREFVVDRCRFAAERGFTSHLVRFDAACVGLPSRRRRFFFVASRLRFAPGRLTHGPGRLPIPTVREALVGVEPGQLRAETMETSFMAKVPQGKVLQEVWDAVNPGVRKGRPGFVRRRLAWDEVSSTVLPTNLYHPEEPRLLTPVETAALAGYPRGYDFVGSITGRAEQVAKAVTPPAAEWLGRAVRVALEAGEPAGEPRVYLWDYLAKDPGPTGLVAGRDVTAEYIGGAP